MTQIQTNERDSLSPKNDFMVHVTPRDYAKKIGRALRTVQHNCKEILTNPKATIDNHRILRVGGRYAIEIPFSEWESLTPREAKVFDYDTWLVELREKRRAQSLLRKQATEAELQALEERRAKREAQERARWDKFCLNTIHDTWGAYLTKREVCAQVADFLRKIKIIGIPRSKNCSMYYLVTFAQNPDLGEFLHLQSDRDRPWHNMSAKLSIPSYLLANSFWILNGNLVFFDGLNPDKTPRNPRICSIERA